MYSILLLVIQRTKAKQWPVQAWTIQWWIQWTTITGNNWKEVNYIWVLCLHLFFIYHSIFPPSQGPFKDIYIRCVPVLNKTIVVQEFFRPVYEKKVYVQECKYQGFARRRTRHSTKKDLMTPNARSSSFYLRKRTWGTILEIRQSLSLESTLTGLRTFLVTE